MKKTKIISCVLIFTFLFTIFTSMGFTSNKVVASDKLTNLKGKQSQLNKKHKELKGKINDIKSDISKKQEYVKAVLEQIDVIQNQIDLEDEKIAELDALIIEKTKNIEVIQKNIDQKSFEFGQRLLAIYKAGETRLLDVFLGAKDFKDLIDKAEIVELIGKKDSALIEELNQNIKSIEEDKKLIEQSKIEVAESKGNLDIKKSELVSLEKENETLISDLKEEMAATNSELGSILQEKEKLENEIESFHRQYVSTNKTERFSKGRYSWPVPGYSHISSPFGVKRSGGRIHRGVDIAGPGIHGAPVVAAAQGIVIKSGHHSSYGNYVMVDHGGGYATLYAHCSKLAVSVGQSVKIGQVLGYVGNTGHSFGNHLHFETLKNGSVYNPAQELF